MSKILLLASCFILLAANAFAQKAGIIKQYVYAQPISGGAMAVDENGRPRSESKKQYLIYIETIKGVTPMVSGIYLNGVSYSGKVSKAPSPVLINASEPGEAGQVVVKKTANQVWQVIVTQDDALLKPTESLRKTISANEFVMKGSVKGKSFIVFEKKIKELQPLLAE